MSGISEGSILYTPIVMMVSVMNTAENIARSAGKVAFAGVIAVHNYNKKQEEKKLKKLGDEIRKLDDAVTENMKEQNEALYRSVENMLKDISDTQSSITSDIDASDAEAFRKLLKTTGKNTIDSIEKIHAQFQKSYTEAINRSNSEISTALTALKEKAITEIGQIESGIQDRDIRAKSRAEGLLEDAAALAASYTSPAGEKYIAEAWSDIAKGNFQSAVSLASSAITQIYMDMYKSDSEEKEKDFYRSSMTFLSAEIKEILASLKSVDFRMSPDSDKVMTADLTQFMKCEYEEFCRRSEDAEKFLVSDYETADSMELCRRTKELNNMITEINEAMADAFYFMSYSLNRVEVEKTIFGIMKEKGFALTDTKYTDGDPSKAGERTYSCALTGEELTVSVIPYSDENSEIKTDLVLMSSESSEESREQYRKDIVERLKNSCSSIESVSLKCREESRNRDAADMGKKTAIRNPQPVRKVQR